MNALLIYPEFPDTFWSFKHALKFLKKQASLPPLGLLTVAAMLPADWPKRLVDVNVRPLSDDDLAWAECVFVSAMAVQRESACSLIARCKQAGLTVVAGGPLFTMEHEQFPEVDHFILNEAELTLPPFLADLGLGCAQRVYATEAFADLEQTPAPLWELLDLERYASVSVQFSRGCPFHCDFCNVTSLLGHRVRTKATAQMLAELTGLYAQGWHGSVFFVDDNFIGNRHQLKTSLLPALIEWKNTRRPMQFNTEASINLAEDPELMRLMVAAGFDTVFVGIETPDEGGLAECSKAPNRNRDLVASVKRIQRAGLEVQGGFIVGFDSDRPSIFQRQIEFIQKSGVVTAMVGLLQAPVGTRLYERLKREGRIRGDWSGDNADGQTNIVPMMNPDLLRAGYRQILQHIYAPEHYYQRVKTFLREYKPAKVRLAFHPSDILALLRSIYHLGIVGQERVHYWKLLLWTNVRRPTLFPLAVRLAIYGYHFRKVLELHVRHDVPTTA
jgi:radical SAM superfamily enzyme YgiQ (UPF0313 family)